jgi:hypothetical protein
MEKSELYNSLSALYIHRHPAGPARPRAPFSITVVILVIDWWSAVRVESNLDVSVDRLALGSERVGDCILVPWDPLTPCTGYRITTTLHLYSTTKI